MDIRIHTHFDDHQNHLYQVVQIVHEQDHSLQDAMQYLLTKVVALDEL